MASGPSGNSWNIPGTNAPNNWLPPSNDESVWSGKADLQLREFYDEYVETGGMNFNLLVKVDQLLKVLFKELKNAETSYPYLKLKPFLKQGGSREGLTVGNSHEFDALLPFTFDGMTTELKDSPINSLPPGLAEICVTKVKNRIRPLDLLVDRGGQKYVSSRVFHDQLFKGLIDKAIQKLDQDPDMKAYSIVRQSCAPAIKLDVIINREEVTIDLVPGFEVTTGSDSFRKFVVTRWIPTSKNMKDRTVWIPDPKTVWRVSYTHFEMYVLDTWACVNMTGKRLVQAARILKALRLKDRDRNATSQFSYIITPYHIKNALLYSLLCLTKVNEVALSSVTEALGYLVFLIKSALDKKRFPQFFSYNPNLKSYFPQYKFHNDGLSVVDLLQERSEREIMQARAELSKSLNHFQLQSLLDKAPDVNTGNVNVFLNNMSA